MLPDKIHPAENERQCNEKDRIDPSAPFQRRENPQNVLDGFKQHAYRMVQRVLKTHTVKLPVGLGFRKTREPVDGRLVVKEGKIPGTNVVYRHHSGNVPASFSQVPLLGEAIGPYELFRGSSCE